MENLGIPKFQCTKQGFSSATSIRKLSATCRASLVTCDSKWVCSGAAICQPRPSTKPSCAALGQYWNNAIPLPSLLVHVWFPIRLAWELHLVIQDPTPSLLGFFRPEWKINQLLPNLFSHVSSSTDFVTMSKFFRCGSNAIFRQPHFPLKTSGFPLISAGLEPEPLQKFKLLLCCISFW